MSDAQFECDLAPPLGFPRVRFNFSNGWAGSLVVRTSAVDAMLASVAACPTGHWSTGQTELGPSEAFADEAIAWLNEIAQRPKVATR